MEPDAYAYTDSENTRSEAFPAKFTLRSDRIREIMVEEAYAAWEERRIYDSETFFVSVEFRWQIIMDCFIQIARYLDVRNDDLQILEFN